MPSGPYALPWPLAPRPPQGAPMSGSYRLIPNVPTRARRAMSRPRCTSPVHTVAASPNPSLANASASASSRYLMTVATGPQISSCAIGMAGVTSASTVGS